MCKNVGEVFVSFKFLLLLKIFFNFISDLNELESLRSLMW